MSVRVNGIRLPVTADIEVARLQVAGEAISAGDPIFLDQASGQWLQARAGTAARMPAEGIAPRAFVLGDSVNPVSGGLVEGLTFVAGDVGDTLFVAAAGGATVTPPNTAADLQQKVGYALSVTQMIAQVDQRQVEIG